MTIKTFLIIFLLMPFCFLHAQDAATYDISTNPIAFESVCFSAVQGNITITCSNADHLSSFEFTGQNTHLAFEWDSANPARCFPMKLSIKPGKATIKYKMRGEKAQVIAVKIEADDAVKLTL